MPRWLARTCNRYNTKIHSVAPTSSGGLIQPKRGRLHSFSAKSQQNCSPGTYSGSLASPVSMKPCASQVSRYGAKGPTFTATSQVSAPSALSPKEERIPLLAD